MIIIAIDPGTGSSSACGVAVLRQSGFKTDLLEMHELWTRVPRKSAIHRIKDISEQLESIIHEWISKEGMENISIAIESFVLRGKSGETLQRFIGAALSRVPSYTIPIIEIANTSMKKFVGGTGKADKEQILKKVLIKFPANQALILAGVKEQYDAIDAVGIGLTAIEQFGKMR